MGPWSQLASQWLPGPSVRGLKAHSIVIKPTKAITDHILFTNIRDPSGTFPLALNKIINTLN